METNLENDFVFKRFDAARQEQIKQLISYSTLLGLSADDLISIGNRLKRIKTSNEAKNNKVLIKELLKNVRVLNASYWALKFDFWYNTDVYECEYNHFKTLVNIKNKRTKEEKSVYVKDYNVGAGIKGRVGAFLVNIKNGDIKIDF